jgi:hypothetical protein
LRPSAARSEYDQGWPMVLGQYAELASGPGDHGGERTWWRCSINPEDWYFVK